MRNHTTKFITPALIVCSAKAFSVFIALVGMHLCISNQVHAQKGPGGVGNPDGVSSLVLWLDANTLPNPVLSTVTNWPDKSGYGHDFSTLSSNGAALITDVSIPGRTFLEFINANSDYYERPFTAALNPTDFTLFFGGAVRAAAPIKTIISSADDPAGPSTKGFELVYSASAPAPAHQYRFLTGDVAAGFQALNVGALGPIGSMTVTIANYTTGANNKKGWLYLNNANTTAILNKNTTAPFRIGASSVGAPNSFFQGWVGEIIMFSAPLNNLQMTIVSDYLEAKWGGFFAPGGGITGRYTMDDLANGDYDFDVAGIGRNATSTQSDSQGTGIVRINVNNITTLAAGEYFFWGHDGAPFASPGSPITTDVPALEGVQARWLRKWRVSETGEVGNIDISFDLSGLGSVVPTDLVLLIDKNNNDQFGDETVVGGGVVTGAISLGGNVYSFNNVDIDNTWRFTLGTINQGQTPLPVELSDFQASPEQNTVHLTWETLTEINNDYFTVLRSSDTKLWEDIQKIKGAGTSKESLTYATYDNFPLKGHSYYKLSQTDFDGKISYSEIRHVSMANLKPTLVTYPNPFSSQLEIRFTGADQENSDASVRFLNTTGSTVLSFTSQFSGMPVLLEEDILQHLVPGVYLIQLSTSGKLFQKKVIKK